MPVAEFVHTREFNPRVYSLTATTSKAGCKDEQFLPAIEPQQPNKALSQVRGQCSCSRPNMYLCGLGSSGGPRPLHHNTCYQSADVMTCLVIKARIPKLWSEQWIIQLFSI